MTCKEAIEKLKEILFMTGYKEALELAIKALEERPQDDLIKVFELLKAHCNELRKAHCKNQECNKDCVFYRELRVGDNTEQFCGLCEIVTSDDKGNDEAPTVADRYEEGYAQGYIDGSTGADWRGKEE